ncbi:MAG: VCBS repeat-containing protein [Ginsengibacter sp.]
MLKRMYVFLFECLIVFILYGCNNDGNNRQSDDGAVLSKEYCGNCHKYPDPSLLSKEAWKNGVLPMMGSFANMYRDKDSSYEMLTPEMVATIRNPAFNSLQFSISVENWKKIVDYYVASAPEVLKNTKVDIEAVRLPFDIKIPAKKAQAFTGHISYNEEDKLIFQSNIKDSLLNIYDNKLQLKDCLRHCKGVVDVTKINNDSTEDAYLVTEIGSFPPTKEANGCVEKITLKNGKITGREMLLKNLYRPVQSIMKDMDNDGKADLVVCEFGWITGQLSLFKNMGNGKYEKSTSSSLPGAEKMYVDDINGDGLPDLWVLFSQAREGIVQFINKGNGKFEQKQLLSFPPCYGSTYFQLADMDNDGEKEIIYTFGDNADYSEILKPYHGVYIFKKIGNNYKQVFFQHLNGCFKAVPVDINGDGKLDLVTISFFADYTQETNGGFAVLINNGGYSFKAYTDTSFANTGRWLCMDVKDVNGDGKPDILLGNTPMNPGNKEELMKRMNGPEFIVLQNAYSYKNLGVGRTGDKVKAGVKRY